MKKLITLIVLLSFAFIANSQNNTVEFELIRKSGFAVSSAHKAALSQNKSIENLNKSIEHQKYAVLLFNENKTEQAIFHSAFARKLAFDIIKANNLKVNDAYNFTQAELDLLKSSPSNSDLENALPLQLKTNESYLNPELEDIHL